jgi:carbon starvation protein
MPAIVLMMVAITTTLLAYRTYGRYVANALQLSDERETPAHQHQDGVDYVPSSRPVVLGHHFASIAGAGPIVGPIVAVSFGWLPTFLWILFGAVFIGAMHDFTTMVASVRHGGRTISDIVEDYVGVPAKRLFVLFAFAALILVIGVFTDIVATTFENKPEVATTSALFVALAVLYGVVTRRFSTPLVPATLVGLVGIALCVYLGSLFPIAASWNFWVSATLIYVGIAAVMPVWALLQPRDYLNSYLLYGMLGAGILGLFVAGPTIQIDAFTGLRHERLGPMFPILFVTVACGAISGFHSLVASGTTSKQLNRETDAKFIGYGGMLLEAVLAVLALIAAGVATTAGHGVALAEAGPIAIFANGVGGFMSALGIPIEAAVSFVALAVSAFALTSLDTCTRLARLLFSEFFSTREARASLKRPGLVGDRYFATVIVVALGAALTFSGSFAAAWPVFGAANQLLAALSLLAVAVWLAKLGTDNRFVLIPMFFMFAVTVVALVQLIIKNVGESNVVLSVIASALLALGGGLFMLALGVLRPAREPGAA